MQSSSAVLFRLRHWLLAASCASLAPAATAAVDVVPAPQPLPPAIVAPPVAAPAVAPTAAADSTAQFNRLFPRYAGLENKIGFWKDVFIGYSQLQTVVHSTEYPHKILRVLDFRGDATTMSPIQLDNHRRKAEQDARAAMDTLLKSVHAKRAAPQTMTAEERRIYDLFSDVRSDNRFQVARETVRTQRGIKERTETALQTSERYLPYMEQIFASYGLPKQLTRLPIVESSFNVEAYSRSHAAGVWQFIPTSAKIYMRLDEVVDDRRDPWTSTDAAARHLRDDYALLQDWPLAVTAYNHGRYGISRGLKSVNGTSLMDLIERSTHSRWGFAGKNYYAEFLAAVEIEREWRARHDRPAGLDPIDFEVVETKHYLPYSTLRRLSGGDDALFRKLNPAYRPEVIDGKLYVPPGHLIRVPAGTARSFEVSYATLGSHERFDRQRVYHLLHKVGKGETLGAIARQYRTSVNEIQKANSLKGSVIRIGQVLKVPPREESRPGPISVAVGESKPSLTRAQVVAARSESDGSTHTVGKGDTLSSIARRYNVSQDSLRRVNNLNSSMIRAGQTLRIPGRGTGTATASTPRAPAYRQHRVASGQTLSSIARRYDVSIADLRDANGMGASNLIKVGQTLRVPAGD